MGTPHYSDQRIATDQNIAALTHLVKGAERIVAFTGAGISTESGIPDYRGPEGVWARNAIPHIDTIDSGDDARIRMWQFRRDSYPVMRARQPNGGHVALASLATRGRLLAVITQNIDGLHQKSGIPSDRVIELHGSTHQLRCQRCGATYDGDAIQRRLEQGEGDPRCTRCGGPLRTATILFGESLPEHALRTAVLAARSCDLMLVVGSSLVVNPAARLPQIAQDAGARVVVINREPTPFDERADLVIHADAGDTLTRAVQALEEESN